MNNITLVSFFVILACVFATSLASQNFKSIPKSDGTSVPGSPFGDPEISKCSICKWAIDKILEKTVIKYGCKEGAALFLGACNAAGDWVPVIGEGVWEAACALGSVAVNDLCSHYGDKWIKDHATNAAEKICDKMHLC